MQRTAIEEEQLINVPYYATLKSTDSIILSSTSTSSQRLSELTATTNSSISLDPSTTPMNPSDFDQFDIIDSLDFDDVDDTLLDQEMTHQQRESIIQELLSTEKQYLETLNIVLNYYITPLRKNSNKSSFNFLGMKKLPCTEREMRWLFGNFEDIQAVHTDILSSLEERLSIWGPTQIISDVIQTWFPRIQQQYHIYFDNYDVLVTTYERLTRYQPFKKFTVTVDKNARLKGTTLLSFLQAPVLCISRYHKLVLKLADNTSSMHPDYVGLMQCKNRIHQIAEEFKIKFDDARNVNRVYDILAAMTGQPFSVKAERRLHLQNNFTRATRLSGEDLSYFLFSDMLVYAKQKQSTLQYKGHIVLNRAKIRALSPEESIEDGWSIEITSPFQGVDSLNTTFMGSPTAQVIHTYSKQDQSKWVSCLEIIVARLDQTQQSKIMINNNKLTPPGSLRRHATTVSSNGSSSNHSHTQESF
ncbi:putative component of NuA3 histone acetyltransferase complex [Mucor velutinosus]|uniref:Component of NuA3 histone acetyltransferase complex n=1 Tax=Mucor velutinosus TaxID=708070 RepID=A0AAN7HLC0_9FUNG|nr:putative component of NuA3 histone acetyltransferase complex [Mucor velutinosus]